MVTASTLDEQTDVKFVVCKTHYILYLRLAIHVRFFLTRIHYVDTETIRHGFRSKVTNLKTKTILFIVYCALFLAFLSTMK